MTPVSINSTVQHPSIELDPAKLGFGEVFSPNMFVMNFNEGHWEGARIEALKALTLHPGSLVLHYAQTIFEGLKAYKQDDRSIVLFRPDLNALRFNRSAARMGMPSVEPEMFVEACQQLAQTERYFVPSAPGSLYLRPTMIATESCLGVRSSKTFLFYVLALPTGAYFKGAGMGTNPVDVLVAKSVVRAFEGGTGSAKTGANYAASLQITSVAHERGCAQVLFLDAVNHDSVEEMGGMNIFFIRDGELVTPPLTGTILAGVVRQSILEMAGSLGLKATEAKLSITELLQGMAARSVTEAFACGTAACVAPIGHFVLEDGTKVAVGDGGVGPITAGVFDSLQGLFYGRTADPYGWTRKVCQLEAATNG